MPRLFRVVLALLAFAAGVGMTCTPVPALPFFLISGALLAEESLTVARTLDRFESWLWRRWKRARRRYGLTPVRLRWAAIILALAMTAFSGSLCYFALAR